MDPAIFIPLHFLAFNGKPVEIFLIDYPFDEYPSERLPRAHIPPDDTDAIPARRETRHVCVARSNIVHTHLHAVQHFLLQCDDIGASVYQFGSCVLWNSVPLWGHKWVRLLMLASSGSDEVTNVFTLSQLDIIPQHDHRFIPISQSRHRGRRERRRGLARWILPDRRTRRRKLG